MPIATLHELAGRAGRHLAARQLRLVTAESCTGGGVACHITAVPGSSDWFECGFIVYSNASKHRLLGVDERTLERWGAVSEQTVRAMTAGALQRCPSADVAVAVSGIAGPSGGTGDKPVGTVWLAWERRGQACNTARFLFDGDRESIRQQAIAVVLEGLCKIGTTPESDSVT